jgi:hypothetical protein
MTTNPPVPPCPHGERGEFCPGCDLDAIAASSPPVPPAQAETDKQRIAELEQMIAAREKQHAVFMAGLGVLSAVLDYEIKRRKK